MVLVENGSLKLRHFPPVVTTDPGSWRLRLSYLGMSDDDDTVWPESEETLGTNRWRDLEYPNLPMGRFEVVFWRQTSQDQGEPPSIPMRNEVYIWRVAVRPRETTEIDVGAGW